MYRQEHSCVMNLSFQVTLPRPTPFFETLWHTQNLILLPVPSPMHATPIRFYETQHGPLCDGRGGGRFSTTT